MGHVEAMTEETKMAIDKKLRDLKPGEVAMTAGVNESGRQTVCIVQRDPNGRLNAILLNREGIVNVHKLLAEVIATAENDVSRN